MHGALNPGIEKPVINRKQVECRRADGNYGNKSCIPVRRERGLATFWERTTLKTSLIENLCSCSLGRTQQTKGQQNGIRLTVQG
jgi:hypothetical protein